MNNDNEGNPIAFTSLDFNSYQRIIRLDCKFFNYLQPYIAHENTPSDGINVYSFSISPEEFQPSGSCNMSRITRITRHIEFDKRLTNENDDETEQMPFRMYTRNYNILRFVSGMDGYEYGSYWVIFDIIF